MLRLLNPSSLVLLFADRAGKHSARGSGLEDLVNAFLVDDKLFFGGLGGGGFWEYISLKCSRQAVEFLSNEGHIFSTIDEDHFKSTDGDE
ncbi:hypothetical protein CRUP_024454 [Coryphaenoides rupestris]|nr:hypothetical protein CRUP_024454 [Coryphaenoides rupestris]